MISRSPRKTISADSGICVLTLMLILRPSGNQSVLSSVPTQSFPSFCSLSPSLSCCVGCNDPHDVGDNQMEISSAEPSPEFR